MNLIYEFRKKIEAQKVRKEWFHYDDETTQQINEKIVNYEHIISLLRKDIPQEVNYDDVWEGYICPSCNWALEGKSIFTLKDRAIYCTCCGQRLKVK